MKILLSMVLLFCCFGCSDDLADALYLPREGLTEEENEHRRFAQNPKNMFNPDALKRIPPSDKQSKAGPQTQQDNAHLVAQMAELSQNLEHLNNARNTVVGVSSYQSLDGKGNVQRRVTHSMVGSKKRTEEYIRDPKTGYVQHTVRTTIN